MGPPRPLPSPEPSLSNGHDALSESGVHRITVSTAKQTKVQWAVIIAAVGALGGLLAWNLDALKDAVVGTANAQAQAKAADDRSAANERKIEAVDAGTRIAIENLRKAMDEDRAATNRKLDMILSEVRKK